MKAWATAACLITGGRPLSVSAVNMECSVDNRLVIAGGTLMNAAAAGLFFFVGRNTRRTSPHLPNYAWPSMTVTCWMPPVIGRSQGSVDSEIGPPSSTDLVRNGPGEWGSRLPDSEPTYSVSDGVFSNCAR